MMGQDVISSDQRSVLCSDERVFTADHVAVKPLM
jgi:hypothetical protein